MVRYREVVLGSVREGGAKRWLEHGEISGGVLEAIERDRLRFVVGEL